MSSTATLDSWLALRAQTEASLLGENSPFAVVTENVQGEWMSVFRNRLPHLRAMLERSRSFEEKPYMIFENARVSYGEHFLWVARTAHRLRDVFEVGPGDRVAIASANQAEWVVLFWAALSLGALPVGLNAWWVAPELAYALDLVAPKVIFADARRRARMDAQRFPMLRDIDEVASWREDGATELPGGVELHEDDAAAVLFSSGTTGRPKGIVATHRNILALTGIQLFQGARAFAMEQAMGVAGAPGGPGLVTTPLFHVSGLYAGVITRMAAGAATVWTTGRFDAEKVMALIEREGCVGWGPTATMVHRLVNHPNFERYDLSSMRFMGLGGSTIPTDLIERVHKQMPMARFSSAVGYGQTECAALATIAWGPELLAYPGTVGAPLPTVAISIRDSEGAEVPDGSAGEVCIRSPLTMQGYYNHREVTEDAFWSGRWLRTGDVGWMYEGRLYIAARQSERIIRGGENMYPAEIESALHRHPAIEECAVVGRADAEFGEVPVAYVVLKGVVTDEELRAYCTERLAYFKVPAEFIRRTEPLPRNASGKVIKASLDEGSQTSFLED